MNIYNDEIMIFIFVLIGHLTHTLPLFSLHFLSSQTLRRWLISPFHLG